MRDETVTIRNAVPDDLEAVYAICLKTGDAGQDASALYADPKLIGHIYAGPYVALDGFISLVAEDDAGVLGYVVGAEDTRDFERRMEAEWWPELRKSCKKPEGGREGWTLDELRAAFIHAPSPEPEEIVAHYPAHIHMNLLPRAQGKGIGSGLLEAWLRDAKRRGVRAVHAGVSARNEAGLKFWTARGFEAIRSDRNSGSSGTVWCGRLI